MRKRVVKIKSAESIIKGELLIADNEITLLYDQNRIVKKGEYAFFILMEIREELEKVNMFMLINGSRKDVYPSGMTAVGHMAYIQTLDKSTLREDLVNIFDETNEHDLIGTVVEQKNYHQEWVDSILRKTGP